MWEEIHEAIADLSGDPKQPSAGENQQAAGGAGQEPGNDAGNDAEAWFTPQ